MVCTAIMVRWSNVYCLLRIYVPDLCNQQNIFQVSADDQYSKYICYNCEYMLNLFFDFRNNCFKTLLTSTLDEMPEDSSDNVSCPYLQHYFEKSGSIYFIFKWEFNSELRSAFKINTSQLIWITYKFSSYLKSVIFGGLFLL